MAEWGCTVAEELLKPTRIYVRLVLDLLAKSKNGSGTAIKAMSHITGGGLLENPNRVLPKGLDVELHWGTWPVPPVFAVLQQLGGVQRTEMLRVYNMGIGFCFVVAAEQVDRLQADLAAAGEASWQIGRVIPAENPAHKPSVIVIDRS